MTVADSTNNDASASQYAVDGDTTSTSSRWVSSGVAGMHWLAIDLAGNYLTSAVNVVSDNRGVGTTQGCEASLQFFTQTEHSQPSSECNTYWPTRATRAFGLSFVAIVLP
jgi:hypothetical protein